MSKVTYIPTKETPCFYAYCSEFGSFGYHNMLTKNCILDCCGIDYMNAVEYLHNFIKNYDNNHKNIKYCIVMIDGTTDKYGDIIRKEVYEITGKQLLKMGFKF